MRRLSYALLVAMGGVGMFLLVACHHESFDKSSPAVSYRSVQGVNPVIGNLSYWAVFGQLPTSATPNKLRLLAHFIFVEEYLRSKEHPSLRPGQKRARQQNLQRLRTYWTNGKFPRNYAYEDRTPCFIDPAGRICAVGYLVERSAGLGMAQKVNQQYQYATIQEMKSPALEEWTVQNGLKKQEIAMIQPAYRPRPSPAPALEIAQSTTLGINVGATIGNSILMGLEKKSTWTSSVGIVTGLTGIGFGISEISYSRTENLVFGATSLTVGVFKLLEIDLDKQKKDNADVAQLYPSRLNMRTFATQQKTIPGIQLGWNF